MKTNERTGVQRIAEERERQINHHHWTSKHDDEHRLCELARAAACYAANAASRYVAARHAQAMGTGRRIETRVRLLEKAGAFIAAEIDRLLRLQKREGSEGDG